MSLRAKLQEDETLRRLAVAISGAPFPSQASFRKARAVATVVETILADALSEAEALRLCDVVWQEATEGASGFPSTDTRKALIERAKDPRRQKTPPPKGPPSRIIKDSHWPI